ncbi:MAG: hypothetical protein KDA05_00580 [Phycisphaerales bacterium]|nr:hypothetical protein [Phycisphaerales bacterium]MCB9840742.1 hypothetical protein [Phycisphaeraceae bacterium]
MGESITTGVRPSPRPLTAPSPTAAPADAARKEGRRGAERRSFSLKELIIGLATVVAGVTAAYQLGDYLFPAGAWCIVIDGPNDKDLVLLVTPADPAKPKTRYRPDAQGNLFLAASARGGEYSFGWIDSAGDFHEITNGILPASGRLSLSASDPRASTP